MPNRSTHIACGACAGALASLFMPSLSHLHPVQRVLLGGGLGAVGGALPDIIEPAETPSRRGIAHSYALLGGTLHGSTRIANPVFALLFVGYASHLILDASTPANIPLIARGV